MASFVFYDLIFLVLFSIGVGIFLYKRRANLKRQGIMYLYRTKIGIEFIEWFSKKYEKLLRPMQYLIIASGYILMVVMIWMLGRFTYAYTKYNIAEQIKIPPILPLFPYATDLFKVDFLPPFYFTYWIIIIAIIALSHEFAHGIFARLNKIRVHSTGFGFLGPFLAAFVEPDEKQMNKAPKFQQLSILAAGTFANILMAVLFGLIFWAFFVFSFTPAGVTFNSYSQAIVNLSSITLVEGGMVDNIADIPSLTDEGLVEIVAHDKIYLVQSEALDTAVNDNIERIIVFEDAPAVRADLKGPVVAIDDVKVTDYVAFREIIQSKSPGERIKISSLDEEGEIIDYSIELEEKEGKAYLGVGNLILERKGISGFVYNLIASVKDPYTYYQSSYDHNFAMFIYNLLWWIVLINISVALVNMLPVGLFDGGRFFYLTIWGITGREDWAKKSFGFATWLLLAVVVWLMIRWAFAFV